MAEFGLRHRSTLEIPEQQGIVAAADGPARGPVCGHAAHGAAVAAQLLQHLATNLGFSIVGKNEKSNFSKFGGMPCMFLKCCYFLELVGSLLGDSGGSGCSLGRWRRFEPISNRA